MLRENQYISVIDMHTIVYNHFALAVGFKIVAAQAFCMKIKRSRRLSSELGI